MLFCNVSMPVVIPALLFKKVMSCAINLSPPSPDYEFLTERDHILPILETPGLSSVQ